MRKAVALALALLMLVSLIPAVFAETELPKTHTFIFMSEGQEYLTVILKGEEKLLRPTNPTSENGTFDGWYADEELTEPFENFGVNPEMDDGVTRIYARFTPNTVKIVYHDTENNIIVTDEAELGSVYTFDAGYPLFDPKANDKVNIAWQDGSGKVYEGEVTITGDLELYPVLDVRYWVRFDTQGGSKLIMQYVKPGDKALRPASPERVGYSFIGWFDAAEGGAEFDFDVPVEANVTVYARWRAEKAAYTVTYWFEEANSDEYTLGATHAVSAEESTYYTGDTALAADINELFCDPHGFEHFIPQPEKTEGGELLGDGSSMFKVYYRRQRFDLTFKGYTAENEYKTYQFYGIKYDQELSDVLAEIQDINYEPENYKIYFLFEIDGDMYIADFEEGHNGGLLVGTENTDPFEDGEIIYTQYLQERLTDKIIDVYKVIYPDVVYPEDAPQKEYDGKTFYYDQTVIFTRYNSIFGVEDMEDFFTYAFTYVEEDGTETSLPRQPRGWFYMTNLGNYNFYFDRRQYDIHYSVGGGPAVSDTLDIYYETRLKKYEPESYVELLPDKSNIEEATKWVNNGDTLYFNGWYANDAYTDKFDFSEEIMPSCDIMLYAKWGPLSYTVTFDPDGGAFTGLETISVNYGEKVAQPDDPVRGMESFLGWTLNGKPYNFDSPVTEDIVLKAWYSGTDTYRVIYHEGEGSGTPPTDPESYLENASANVMGPGGLIPPEGMEFVAWRAEDGSLVYPGGLVYFDREDIELTAVYGKDPVLTSFIYDLNYSHFGIRTFAAEEEEVALLNNDKLTLRSPRMREIPRGWLFAGWYLDEDCTEEAPDRMLVCVENEPNVVYAKWVKETTTPTPEPEPEPEPTPEPEPEPTPEPEPMPDPDPEPKPVPDPDPEPDPEPEPEPAPEETEIGENETPLDGEEELDIGEEETPLDGAPETGDTKHTALWIALGSIAALGAVALIVFGKKKK